jgi:hypothetical protein
MPVCWHAWHRERERESIKGWTWNLIDAEVQTIVAEKCSQWGDTGINYNVGKFRKVVKSRLHPSKRFRPITMLKHSIIALEEVPEATMLNFSKGQCSSSFHPNLQILSLCSRPWKVKLSIIHWQNNLSPNLTIPSKKYTNLQTLILCS